MLFLSNPQDSSENIFHFSIFNSGHNGLVQYLLELSKLSHTGKDYADKKTVFLFYTMFCFCVCFFFVIKMIIFFPQGACIKLIDACLVSRHILSQHNIFKLPGKCNISRWRIEQLGSSFGFISLESPMIVA